MTISRSTGDHIKNANILYAHNTDYLQCMSTHAVNCSGSRVIGRYCSNS